MSNGTISTNEILFAGPGGVMITDGGFTYNKITQTLTVTNLAATNLSFTGITGKDLTLTGNTTLGDSGADTVTFTAKVTGQIYNNDTGKTTTNIKMHNHDCSAEIGGAEFKGELTGTTGYVPGVSAGTYDGVVCTYSYTPTGGTAAVLAVRGGVFVMSLPTSNTMTTGWLNGATAATDLTGTLNGATVHEVGLLASVTGAGTRTLVAHSAALQASIGAGVTNPTTGELSNILLSGNGVTTIDNSFFIDDHAHTTNFLNLSAAGNTGFVTTGGTDCTASGATDPSFTLKCIMPGGAAGYIRVWAAA